MLFIHSIIESIQDTPLKSTINQAYSLIFESTYQKDIEQYQYCGKIVDILRDLLKNKEYDALDDGTFLVKGKYIDDDLNDLLVLIVPKENARTNISFGKDSARLNYAYGHTSKYKVIVCAYLNSYGDDSYIDSRLDRTAFSHELTHYLDDKRSNGGVQASHGSNTLSDYYNSPAEFNAFYSETALFILDIMQKNELVLNSMKKYTTFEAFRNMIIKQFDQEFINNLNESYRRKLDKRLYNLYEEFKKLIKSSD